MTGGSIKAGSLIRMATGMYVGGTTCRVATKTGFGFEIGVGRRFWCGSMLVLIGVDGMKSATGSRRRTGGGLFHVIGSGGVGAATGSRSLDPENAACIVRPPRTTPPATPNDAAVHLIALNNPYPTVRPAGVRRVYIMTPSFLVERLSLRYRASARLFPSAHPVPACSVS